MLALDSLHPPERALLAGQSVSGARKALCAAENLSQAFK